MKNHPNKIKVVLIDDEPDALFVLKKFLNDHPDVIVLAEANDVATGMAAIHLHQPDLIFLDIQLGDKNGFDLLNHFPLPTFQIIFCTGFAQFALQAIKNNALDYLIKPIDPEELKAAVQKAIQQKTTLKPPRLAVHASGEVLFVDTNDVCQIESDGAYTTIQLADNRRFVQVRSLREYEEILPAHSFFRTHQSHLVNLNYIEKFHPENLTLKMRNGSEIPVARRRRAEMTTALGL
ncbi:MAG: hypothetical protein RIR11_548 [Bacteroidota bacterium]|jgi:two-component system LytT family response regulator